MTAGQQAALAYLDGLLEHSTNPLLLKAATEVRAELTAGDPRTPTPDGHATCPRCEQKARTA